VDKAEKLHIIYDIQGATEKKKCYSGLKLSRKHSQDFILVLKILLLRKPKPRHLFSESYGHVC